MHTYRLLRSALWIPSLFGELIPTVGAIGGTVSWLATVRAECDSGAQRSTLVAQGLGGLRRIVRGLYRLDRVVDRQDSIGL